MARHSIGPVLCTRCGRVDKGYREADDQPWLCGDCEGLRLAGHAAIAGLLVLAILALYGAMMWSAVMACGG